MDRAFPYLVAVALSTSLAINLLLLDAVVSNQLKLALIESKISVGTGDRYRAADARRDFEQIRNLIAQDRKALDVAVQTRDEKLLVIERKLKAIEAKLNEKSE